VEVAVLRLGRLGDLVMVQPALQWLADTRGVRVRLVTDAHYIEAWSAAVPHVAVTSELGSPDLVLDLHRVAASRRLRRGHRWLGVDKEAVRRRLRVLAPGMPVRIRRSWPERHMDAAERAMRQLRIVPGPRPAPIPRLRAGGPREPGLLGLVPGAGHATKRWPTERFDELAARWPGRTVVFGSEAERPLLRSIRAEAWPDCSLTGLIDGLSRCEVVVAGDTGPLHVAGAVGCRVVGLFGPTPTDTGFWVWGGQGTAVGTGLGCSPCSLHGGAVCPRRHHRCLVDLPVDVVFAAALQELQRRPGDRCA
jgi:ADP-heptose:LPS heptosyltransferase